MFCEATPRALGQASLGPPEQKTGTLGITVNELMKMKKRDSRVKDCIIGNSVTKHGWAALEQRVSGLSSSWAARASQACSGSDQAWSPSDKVKAATTQVSRLKRTQLKKIVMLSMRGRLGPLHDGTRGFPTSAPHARAR